MKFTTEELTQGFWVQAPRGEWRSMHSPISFDCTHGISDREDCDTCKEMFEQWQIHGKAKR